MPPAPVGQLIHANLYWIPALVFVVHLAEEYPRFPEWATRHFNVTSRAWFVYSHLVLVPIVFAISASAQGTSATAPFWRMLATAIQWALATNVVFHVVTLFLFREYSPGIVTALLLVVPTTVYVFTRTARDGLLPPSQIAFAIALGTLIGISTVASLWARTDFDWKMRRANPAH